MQDEARRRPAWPTPAGRFSDATPARTGTDTGSGKLVSDRTGEKTLE
jgi:hypothetical protein